MSNPVTAVPAAESDVAAAHFESSLSFETDCWDTHFALQSEEPGFVLLDVRSPDRFASGHVPGAISEEKLDEVLDVLSMTRPAG